MQFTLVAHSSTIMRVDQGLALAELLVPRKFSFIFGCFGIFMFLCFMFYAVENANIVIVSMFCKYPPAPIILGWGPKAAEARRVVGLLPQDDRLLRHVEVVLAQLILGDHHHDDHTHSNCRQVLPA